MAQISSLKTYPTNTSAMLTRFQMGTALHGTCLDVMIHECETDGGGSSSSMR